MTKLEKRINATFPELEPNLCGLDKLSDLTGLDFDSNSIIKYLAEITNSLNSMNEELLPWGIAFDPQKEKTKLYKNERINLIEEDEFLYFVMEYVLFSTRKLSKKEEINFRQDKSRYYKKQRYDKIDSQQLETLKLMELVTYIAYDTCSWRMDKPKWESYQTLYLNPAYELIANILTNLFYIDIPMEFSTFEDHLQKYLRTRKPGAPLEITHYNPKKLESGKIQLDRAKS